MKAVKINSLFIVQQKSNQDKKNCEVKFHKRGVGVIWYSRCFIVCIIVSPFLHMLYHPVKSRVMIINDIHVHGQSYQPIINDL